MISFEVILKRRSGDERPGEGHFAAVASWLAAKGFEYERTPWGFSSWGKRSDFDRLFGGSEEPEPPAGLKIHIEQVTVSPRARLF